MQKHLLLLLVICGFSVVLNGQSAFASQPLQLLSSQIPDKQTPNAAAVPPVAEIGVPVQTACPGSFIQFADESQNTPTSWSWTFPGGTPSSSSLQHPVVFYPDPGTYSASLTVTNADGSSSATSDTVNVQEGHVKYLFYDAMEGGLDNWMVENPDNSTTWAIMNIGGTVYGRQAAFMDNYNYDAEGEKDALVTPLLDFSEETGMRLLVDYAYQRHSLAFNDELRIYVSTDGGSTYPDEVFFGQESGGGNFSTTPDGTDQFFPSVAADWCHSGNFGADCLNIDLSSYAGESQVRIKIENTNGFGNNLFIDHVRITADCSMPEPPAAFFTTSTASGCAPLTVEFIDSSQGVVDSWQWSFPGGTPDSSNLENPLVSYTVPGSYPVTLTVSNDAGSSTTSLNGNIEVTGPPEPLFEYSIQGLTVAFNNLSGNYTSVEWKFGDGTESEEVSPAHTYAAPGVYTVELVAANECGKEEFTEEVTIVPPPTAAFQSESLSGCAPVLMQFINTSSFGETFHWAFENGNPVTSTDPDPICSFAAPGTYEVTLITSNGTGSDTLTQTVFVSGAPQSSFFPDYTPGDFTVSFQNTSLDAFFFEWDFGDGSPVNTDFFPTHTYDTTGFYTVTLIATNECGSDTTIREVAILLPPVAGFSLPQDTVCAPFSVEPVNTSEGIVENWLWIANGTNPDTATVPVPSFTFDTPGTYDIVLQATNAAGSSRDTATIVVGITPTSAFSLIDTLGSPQIFTVNTSVNADTYFWSFGDGSTSDESAPVHTYTEDNDYLVTLITGNACGTDTLEQMVSIVTLPVAGIGNADTSGCSVFVLTPEFAGTSNYDTISWFAPGSLELTADTETPTFTFPLAGQYAIIQSVSNAAGSSTDTLTISVGEVPDANFEGNPVPDTTLLELTNNSTGATAFVWDFGDGNTSTAASPSHTYTDEGNYSVTLIATNACGADTIVKAFSVITLPVASIDLEIVNGCLPFTVNPVGVASANTEASLWTAPGATPETAMGMTPAFTYTEAGTYTIYLEASNAAGTSIDSTTVEVLGLPEPAFSAEVDGFSIHLANASTSAQNFTWSFGDGNSSEASAPTHTYASPGDYDITLTAANACGQADTTVSVSIVLPPPTAGFEVESTSGCTPFEVAFTNTSEFGESFEWVFPGGTPATDTVASPVVVYEAPGVYNATLIVTNTSGSDTIELPDLITVGSGPQAGFGFSVDQATVTFTNTAVNGEAFQWFFGDGTTSTEVNPVHNYGMAGTFDVTLIAENTCGADTLQQTVEIAGQAPEAMISFGSAVSACTPLTLELFASSSEGAPAEVWQWLLPGGAPETATGDTITVTYNAAGGYSITLIGTNVFGADTLTLTDTLELSDPPVAGFSYEVEEGDVTFLNTSTGTNLSYQWDFGDGTGSTDPNPLYSYTETGQYNVSLTVANACDTLTISEVLNIMITSTGEWATPEAFEVYPNPNRGLFTVEVTALTAEYLHCQLYNLMGQQLRAYKSDFRSGYWQQNIDGTALPAGVYLLELRIGQQRAYRRVVVE